MQFVSQELENRLEFLMTLQLPQKPCFDSVKAMELHNQVSFILKEKERMESAMSRFWDEIQVIDNAIDSEMEIFNQKASIIEIEIDQKL
jgi:hypothetical protein